MAERSIAGHIEHWARAGRAVEPLLQGAQALALCRAGDARPLSACLESVDSPEGQRRVADYLQTRPYPHYEPADAPGLLVRIMAGPDGSGETTFYHAHLRPCGLRFLNADVLAAELDLDPYDAAQVADVRRGELLKQGESLRGRCARSNARRESGGRADSGNLVCDPGRRRAFNDGSCFAGRLIRIAAWN